MNITYKPILSDYYKAVNFYLKQTAKDTPCKSIKERTQDFIDVWSKQLESLSKENHTKSEVSALELSAFIQDLNKKLPHVFIEDRNLMGFLKDIEIKDTDIVKGFITENDAPYISNELSRDWDGLNWNKLFEMASIAGINTSFYALHSPDESYLIASVRDSYANGRSTRLIVFNDSKDYSLVLFDGNEASYINKDPMTKLGVNFLAYINAFPECLTEGVPQNISKKSKAGYQNARVLKTSSHVLEIGNKIQNESNIITPHFRKGHFRYLRDDRFVNKKGQIVFVKASMVRGHAQSLKKKYEDKDYGREKEV